MSVHIIGLYASPGCKGSVTSKFGGILDLKDFTLDL